MFRSGSGQRFCLTDTSVCQSLYYDKGFFVFGASCRWATSQGSSTHVRVPGWLIRTTVVEGRGGNGRVSQSSSIGCLQLSVSSSCLHTVCLDVLVTFYMPPQLCSVVASVLVTYWRTRLQRAINERDHGQPPRIIRVFPNLHFEPCCRSHLVSKQTVGASEERENIIIMILSGNWVPGHLWVILESLSLVTLTRCNSSDGPTHSSPRIAIDQLNPSYFVFRILYHIPGASK